MTDLASIFKAYDIRGRVGTQLNPDAVKNIARAYADWLPTQGTIAVGHDMRPSSAELSRAFIEGLTEQGYDVWDIGLVTSDMIYFAVGKWNLAGSAAITASHNPNADNGIKLYRDQVIAVGLDAGLAEIRDNFLADKFQLPAARPGKVEKRSITDEWVEHCLTFVDNMKPFNIAIDAGNGMAGEILPHILPKLPVASQNLYFELDANFPNHEANPMKVETLADLSKTVLDSGLDFGLAFDADGDRAGLVDDLGRPVNGSYLIALVAWRYLQKYPGAKIVHDVRTSRAVTELIKEWGGEPVRTKAGRVNIGTLMRQIGAPFGGETTGHLFFKENYDADSGLIAALAAMQALSDSGKKLSELVDEYSRYVMPPEINFRINEPAAVIFERLKTAWQDTTFDEIDGITIWHKDWWFNLRPSNTEPIIRLNIEANDPSKVDEVLNQLKAHLGDAELV